MGIGGSIALIALGAIMAFGVQDSLSGVDLTMIGYILMGAGVIGLLVTMILMRPRENRRVSAARTTVDPATGESVTRRESVDNGPLL